MFRLWNVCNRKDKRALRNRLKEHISNIILPSEKHSVLTEHKIAYKSFNWHTVYVLNVKHMYYPRLISDTFYIKSNTSTINVPIH